MIEEKILIPKKIHYCWLSDDPIPASLKLCMDSWERLMPEYEIIRWDTKRFDISSNIFVEEAFKVRKWAFATDYIRLYALYTEGGIYLDTDVFVLKKFDNFLEYGFFTSVEYSGGIVSECNSNKLLNSDGTSKNPGTEIPGIQLQAAVMGGVKGHPFLYDCLQFYKDRHFIMDNGEYFNKIIAPSIYAIIAEKYGFVYRNMMQALNDNMKVFQSAIFAPHLNETTDQAYAIHLCIGGWREVQRKSPFKIVFNKLKNNKHVRRLFRKPKMVKNEMSFDLRKEGNVNFKVFTVKGKLLFDFPQGHLNKGKHVFNWKSQSLPDGWYLCKVINEQSIVKEVLLKKSVENDS
jgi:hypothetical protein